MEQHKVTAEMIGLDFRLTVLSHFLSELIKGLMSDINGRHKS